MSRGGLPDAQDATELGVERDGNADLCCLCGQVLATSSTLKQKIQMYMLLCSWPRHASACNPITGIA